MTLPCLKPVLRVYACAALGLLLWCPASSGQASDQAQSSVIYSTGFEFEEGYDPQFTLVGQDGWIGFGSGGNGLLTNFFQGFGQQAYIGFNPPVERDDLLNVWRPVDIARISGRPIVKFSVMMRIIDSSNNQFDDFRWSVYNTNGHRFFSLDFDNAALRISYGLDDNAGFVPTNLGFDNQGFYDLEITMNFARNLWSASLNDTVLVNSKPITTKDAALNLGDIDAVWSIRKAGAPGNNYMVFDNYRITAESEVSMRPRLEALAPAANGQLGVRVHGEPNLNYVIEASADLIKWVPLQVVTAPAGGIFDYRDKDSDRNGLRFYRAWHRP